MKKGLLASVVLVCVAVLVIGCGDSAKPKVAPQTNSVAFMQEVQGSSYTFTPVLGRFTGNQFTQTHVKDPSTGKNVEGMFYSIILSRKGDKVTFDLYGGIEESSTHQWDIFVGNSDGTGLVQITNDTEEDSLPQFNPEGNKVIFTSDRLGPDQYWYDFIVTRNVDGTGDQVLPLPPNAYGAWTPTYSPDGSKIAAEVWGYAQEFGWFDGIFVMNADGSNPVMLTNPYTDCYCWDDAPSFTSDGTKIVFSRDDDSGDTELEDIYIINADGTGAATKLTDGTGINSDPLVLQDPKTKVDRILFASNRDNLTSAGSSGYELYTMNVDGSGLTRLTNNSLFDAFCADWYEAPSAGAARSQRHVQPHAKQNWLSLTPEKRLRW
jgi:Tol biopolymer transport system component